MHYTLNILSLLKRLNMKIGLAADHAGFEYKEKLKKYLIDKGFTVEDFGTDSAESCDYADFAHPMAYSVESGNNEFGISLCGSGNGINMTVNKHKKIRSALCWNTKIADLARRHNDANVCALPARFISYRMVRKIVDIFLHTPFDEGRHRRRIEKIPIKS